MNRTKLPIRKRIGNVPQLSGSVEAAVAESANTLMVKPAPRLGLRPKKVGFENLPGYLEVKDALGSARKSININKIRFVRYLHSEISERPELAKTFAFIDPGSTYYLNAEFETYIVNRLKEGNPDRLFFLPHNQKALKSFNSETGRGNHKPSKAKFLIGSPKQPGGTECAYVVIHYMKEIINDTRLTLLQSGYRRLACVTPRSSLMKYVLKLSDISKSTSEQFLVLLWFWTGYVDLNI
ncbi:hypothetical protein AgCh_010075 [Apium graveolens]